MLSYHPQIPILLILSDRIPWAAQLPGLLATIQPKRLYVYLCDGLRKEAVQLHISWPCKLIFKQESQAPRAIRPLIAANRWFFQREEAGIVLNLASNWGCLPSVGFFDFCAELLEKYHNDERIGHISCGRILRSKPLDRQASYTFNHVPDTSFYASWRRVWLDFDTRLKTFRAFKRNKLFEKLPAYREFAPYWSSATSGKQLPEAAQYEYVLLTNNRLCIVPAISHVTYQEHPTATSSAPLVHPCFMVEDTETVLQIRELQLGVPYKQDFGSTSCAFLADRLTALTNPAGQNMRIPRIIHHVCDYPKGVPQQLLDLAATWQKHHPEWEQRFWNRRQMEEFVHTVCPDFEPYYRAFPHDVQRWDAIRYLILFHIGGMYVDLDYECFRPFDAILTGKNCYIATEPDLNAKYYGLPHILSNALMAATPGDRFMAAAIEELKTQNPTDFAGQETYKIVLQTSGPLMLTRVYEALTCKKGITLLPSELFMPLTPKEIALAVQNRSTEFIRYKLNHAFALHYFFNSW